MAVILVDTLVQNNEFTLNSTGDQFLETSAGLQINDDGLQCVQVDSAGAHSVTVDGLFYSDDMGEAVALELAEGSTNVYVNGQVDGDIGVEATDEFFITTENFISVSAQGTIVGLTQQAVLLEGNSGASTDNTVSNAGEISASLDGQTAVEAEDGGGDLVSNSGLILGSIGVYLSDNIGAETVENSGTIKGGNSLAASAITSIGSSVGVAIVNSGTITDGGANAAGSSYALMHFADLAGTMSSVDNEGAITGSGYVIQSASDILDLSNSGTIHGGIYLKVSGDVITNSKTGAIDGSLSIASGGDAFTNSGSIDGAVTFTGSGATDTLINTGEITGNISVASAHSLLSNSGEINGNVNFSATETLHNYASIFGNVSAGTGDYFVNYGIIHGDETLNASDTVAIAGDVTGAIVASTNDLLCFRGNFGNQTVSDFIAGTGSTHDTIEFWGTTFSTFSQVQAASTAVGSDTVIRLDATDALTLQGIAPSSLVSADFKFV